MSGCQILMPIILAALMALGCGGGETYQKPPTPVAVRAVETYAGDGGVRYSANILPYSRVDLAFKVNGYVQAILQVTGVDGRKRHVHEGDWVRRGTVLAQVRQSDYEAKLGQAQSQAAEARAARKHAHLEFERATALFASKSLTKSDYDAARARFEAAQAKSAGAAAQVREVKIVLDDCSLKAPMDALVLKRQLEVGSLVGPGTVGFILANTTTVKVIFGVSDLMLKNLRLGQTLPITTEALRGREFTGQITAIAPSADPQSRVFEVELTIPNPQQELKAGMVASVQVGGEPLPQPVAVAPLSAIVRPPDQPEGYAVFVVEDQGGKPVARLRRGVKLGKVYGNMIAVTEGLNLGDRVIVTGATLVTDGQVVRIIPPSEK